MEDTLWDEFLDMCDAELMMLKFSEKYNVEFISSNTDLLSNKGQVIDHKDKDTVVSYVIRITNIETGEIEEINSSILIPSSNKIDECYIKR